MMVVIPDNCAPVTRLPEQVNNSIPGPTIENDVPIYFNSGLLDILEQSPQDISHRGFINNDWSLPPCTMYQEYANAFTVLIKPTF